MEPTRRSAEPSNEAQPIQEEKKGVKEKTSMAAQREKIGKSHEAPEARKAPIKPMFTSKMAQEFSELFFGYFIRLRHSFRKKFFYKTIL